MLQKILSDALRRAWNWLTVADYKIARDEARIKIVARYARGNVQAQNGRLLLDEDDLARRSKAADRALARLNKLLPSDAR